MLKEGELYSSSSRGEYLHQLFSIFAQICLFPLIYLFNHMDSDIYFILWVILQFNSLLWKIYFIFQHWPLGALSVGSCVPLTCIIFILNWHLCLLFLTGLRSPRKLWGSTCPQIITLPGTPQTRNKRMLNTGSNGGRKDVLGPGWAAGACAVLPSAWASWFSFGNGPHSFSASWWRQLMNPVNKIPVFTTGFGMGSDR